MFTSRKNTNIQEKQGYPTSKYDTNKNVIPPPPSPSPPNTTNTITSFLGGIYTNILTGIGLGVGSSLGREIIQKNLSSTEPEKTPKDILLFTTNTHLGDKNPCQKEYKEYEEAVAHYLHYNDFSVEEYHKKYMKCLENNYGDHSKKINLLHH